MNEIEKAIAYFEDAVRESDEIIEDCSPVFQAELIEQKGYFVVALTALREKQKREKGCEYCENERKQLVSLMCNGGGKSKYYNPAFTPHYCPICGKRLEVGP